MSERESEALGRVYAARTTDELSAAYSAWSNVYDQETAAAGYCLPFVIGSWVARHVPADARPLLDAGCGTGLSGPYLQALGYRDIEGLDMSEDMLALAAGRSCYSSLKIGTLGQKLPWPDGHFAAFFCTGVFTEGHAPASALEELVRITRKGGHAIFTVRDVMLEKGGFTRAFEALESAGRWRPVEASAPFRAFAVAEPDVLVRAFVFEVL
ncbi:methyltransferase family protein [Rhizobium subbaraonis]|uniref:Methyltransferase family protein n=1 Tax=Rhizobium subbaraonis TaxID=908946 RepID=A0A285UN51_9HYPH|nr:class I SAM-dependent methyltransferase [Rhizobium subbaraonis]SOC43310.1 methyltransferase family protein [Rhizobium subbaraonis]